MQDEGWAQKSSLLRSPLDVAAHKLELSVVGRCSQGATFSFFFLFVFFYKKRAARVRIYCWKTQASPYLRELIFSSQRPWWGSEVPIIEVDVEADSLKLLVRAIYTVFLYVSSVGLCTQCVCFIYIYKRSRRGGPRYREGSV